jgi:hypothetical protein
MRMSAISDSLIRDELEKRAQKNLEVGSGLSDERTGSKIQSRISHERIARWTEVMSSIPHQGAWNDNS